VTVCLNPSEVMGITVIPSRHQEGELIGVVGGATVFDDADSSGRDLLDIRWSRKMTQSETYSSKP